MQNTVTLNLARRWRSKTFDQIVGQDISVRILKNSLYLNQFFPVYLFSGQRGCGKTTTARVLTAAVNCDRLPDFQTDPQKFTLPCLHCPSCAAMQQGKHPDFIEIDAASHTGVDNVRQIIETASFLPVLGRKKVYLIDEAHMLSKAAFNAFLKILEEPPAAALFILATTDVHKIIDTVRSRSFQLFFGPPPREELVAHLKHMCEKENITCNDDVFPILIDEADGSIRDAINILEQVRFSTDRVTKESLYAILGRVSDEALFVVLEAIAQQDGVRLVQQLSLLEKQQCDPLFMWTRLLTLLKAILYAQHGTVSDVVVLDENVLSQFSEKTYHILFTVLSVMLEHELQFMRTINKRLFLDLLLLRCLQAGVGEENRGGIEKKKSLTTAKAVDPWDTFMQLILQQGDQVLLSVFKQCSRPKQEEIYTDELLVTLSSQFHFFKDLLLERQAVYEPLLQEAYGRNVSLQYVFVEEPIVTEKKLLIPSAQQEQHDKTTHLPLDRFSKKREIDVSDVETWPIANELLSSVTGKIYEVVEGE